VIFPVNAPRVSAEAVRAAIDVQDDDEGKLFADDQRAAFTASVDARQPVATGVAVDLGVDVQRLHFFDPTTGAALNGASPDQRS
jgi:multiple sugar transport system ATP-binding protein